MIYLFVFTTLGLTFIQDPGLSGGWFWDLANGIGLTVFALMVYLYIDSGSGARQQIHQLLGYAIATLVTGHILLLWLPDTAIWHYLSYDAPHYMWAGLLSLIPLILLTATSAAKSRRSWHGSYQKFSRLHAALSQLTLVLVLWHMIGSGFYLSSLEAGLFIALAVITWQLSAKGKLPTPHQGISSLHVAWLAPLTFVAAKYVL